MEYDGLKVYTNSDGYYVLKLGNKKITGLHRYIWEKKNGLVPNGFDVHHKNKIKTDNRIDNLELVNRKEHRTVHAREARRGFEGWIKRDGEWFAKKCSNCSLVKELKEFPKAEAGLHFRSYCRSCRAELSRKAYHLKKSKSNL